MGACESKSGKKIKKKDMIVYKKNSTELEKFSFSKNYELIPGRKKKLKRLNSGQTFKLRILNIPSSISVVNLLKQLSKFKSFSSSPFVINIHDYSISDDNKLALIEDDSEGKFIKVSGISNGNISSKVSLIWMLSFLLEEVEKINIIDYYDPKMIRINEGVLRINFMIQVDEVNKPINLVQNVFKHLVKRVSPNKIRLKNSDFKDAHNKEIIKRLIEGLFPNNNDDLITIQKFSSLLKELARKDGDHYIKVLSKDGGVYQGSSNLEIREGLGYQYWGEDQSCYLGSFKDDNFDGYGIMKWNQGLWKGDMYSGNYKNGKREGFGIYKSENGDIYQGNYKEDKKDGFGEKYCASNGFLYKGYWKANKRNGKGKVIAPDGRVQIAVWNDGEKILKSGERSLILNNTNTFPS